MAYSIESLVTNCNDAFPSTGIWGYMTLLKGDLTTGLVCTANPTTNQLTAATAHGLVVGSRIRLTSGTLPTPLLANTDYFAIVVSATIFAVATTLADARSATAIDLIDAGAGTLTMAEQILTERDPLSVLINKEISHPSWSRAVIENLGVAADAGGLAAKPIKTLQVANTSAVTLSYQHYLFIESITAGALGNVPAGAGFILESASGIQTIAQVDPPRAIFFRLRMRNV